MKIKFLVSLLIFSTSHSFSQEKIIKTNGNEIITIDSPENGKVENGIYTCNKFNWKIDIPNGYTLTDIEKVKELEQKGYSAMKSELPNGMDVIKNPPHLIGFQKDNKNTFSSSFTSLKGTKKFTLEEHKQFVAKLIRDTYESVKGLKFEQTESNIKIGKYNFYKIQDKLYHPKTNELLLTQDMYSCYISDSLFSVNINYSNDEDKIILTDNFIKSLEK
jgi:hypothetical protein